MGQLSCEVKLMAVLPFVGQAEQLAGLSVKAVA